MTATLAVPVRERWRTRDMRIDRWRKQAGDRIRHGDTVVDLVVDGIPRSIVYSSALDQDPVVTLSWCYQGDGGEVGPWGQLAEYSNYEHAGAHPDHHEFRTYRRRQSYPSIFISYRRLRAETFAGRLQAALADRMTNLHDIARLTANQAFQLGRDAARWNADIARLADVVRELVPDG